MRRRLGIWLVVAFLVVFGGFGAALLLLRGPNNQVPYTAAYLDLKARFPSTPQSSFWVADLDDPRTSVVHDGKEVRVSGVMRTNNPQLGMNTKSSKNGEIKFTAFLRARWKSPIRREFDVHRIDFHTDQTPKSQGTGL